MNGSQKQEHHVIKEAEIQLRLVLRYYIILLFKFSQFPIINFLLLVQYIIFYLVYELFSTILYYDFTSMGMIHNLIHHF